MRVFERAQELTAIYRIKPPQGVAVPFGINAPDLTWRVSEDVWGEIATAALFPLEGPPPGVVLYGFPLTIDATLPPNSMLLEP